MGLSISSLISTWLGVDKKARIICVGLDCAGKTTLLYRIKLNEVVTTIPTLGFNVETVKFNNVSFTMWDLGGQERIRRLWRHYYEGTDGLVFVVDSNDRNRLQEAAKSLQGVLSEDALANCSVLIFANKQDMNGCASISEIADVFQVQKFKQRNWHIQGCTATTGDGVYEGFEWLTRSLAK